LVGATWSIFSLSSKKKSNAKDNED
jgi:hypothetical protein